MTDNTTIRLSGKHRKDADRLGGIELMLPWPSDVEIPAGEFPPIPTDLLSDMRRWAEAEGLALLGWRGRRVTHGHVKQHGVYLALHLVSPRYADATRRKGLSGIERYLSEERG